MKPMKITHTYILFLGLLLMAAPPAYGDDSIMIREEIEGSVEYRDTGFMAVSLMLFGKTVSRADGRRCVMYPSCSHYSGQAFKKHGFLKGWTMTADRLLRCGRDEKEIAEEVVMGQQTYVYDPLERNDFWWARP